MSSVKISNRKLNAEKSLSEYKKKWGLIGYRFMLYNYGSRCRLFVVKDGVEYASCNSIYYNGLSKTNELRRPEKITEYIGVAEVFLIESKHDIYSFKNHEDFKKHCLMKKLLGIN